jgi:hypothetical protein
VRRVALIGIVAAVAVPVALAANGEPQEQLTKADQAKARAASLRLGDFPAGWSAKRSPSSPDADTRCAKYDPDLSDLVKTGDYDSPDFTRADGSFVSVATGVFRTVRMARAGFSRVAVPSLPGCFAEVFRKGLGQQGSARVVRAGTLRFPRVGDRTNAYRLSVSVEVQGQTIPVTADLVLFNKGRVDVAMIFLGLVKPLPASLERSLAARVAARA